MLDVVEVVVVLVVVLVVVVVVVVKPDTDAVPMVAAVHPVTVVYVLQLH